MKILSLITIASCIAFSSCKDNGVTYEQVLVNDTNQNISVSAGSGSCSPKSYDLHPGNEQVVHSARVLNPPSSCDNHHYMVTSGPNNLNDIADMSNWVRTEIKDVVRCEFHFMVVQRKDTTTTK